MKNKITQMALAALRFYPIRSPYANCFGRCDPAEKAAFAVEPLAHGPSAFDHSPNALLQAK